MNGEHSVEMPGRSAFLRVGDEVFHTYSVYARGLETIGGSYYLLDETRARPAGGVGGAEGARRRRTDRYAELRVVARLSRSRNWRSRGPQRAIGLPIA